MLPMRFSNIFLDGGLSFKEVCEDVFGCDKEMEAVPAELVAEISDPSSCLILTQLSLVCKRWHSLIFSESPSLDTRIWKPQCPSPCPPKPSDVTVHPAPPSLLIITPPKHQHLYVTTHFNCFVNNTTPHHNTTQHNKATAQYTVRGERRVNEG